MIRWTVVALAAWPAVAEAQTVRGTLTEQASRQPIAGAVVLLLDASEAVVARDLTTEAGSYRLTAPRPGRYRLRTLRIGFRPTISAPIDLAASQDATLPLSIESVPVTLSTVRVESRANCAVRGDVAPAYNAWNEVATALNAALISTRLRGTTATIVGYDRWTEPGSDVVLRQGTNVRTGLPGQPWRSIPADSLHRNGFVIHEADGSSTFHVPDLDVLLSDTFLQDHCLSLSGVENGQIAIEFVPARDRGRLPEIRGFVWLDASNLELKRLQFRYVNVLREYEENAGGDLEFLRLRNGNWVISRWQVRMPTGFKRGRTDSFRGMTGQPDLRATEVKITGGDLLRVVMNGDTLWSTPPRTFNGRVLDSVSRRPMAGAQITLAGTAHGMLTDERGRFQFSELLPGSYRVQVSTPALDSLAYVHRISTLFVDPSAPVEVLVPSRDHVIGRLCPEVLRPGRQRYEETGLLLGLIRNSRDSTPIANARLTVEWQEPDLATVSATDRELRIRADAAGFYVACGPSADRVVKVSTQFDGDSPPLLMRIGPGRIRRLDVWVRDGQRVIDSTATLLRP